MTPPFTVQRLRREHDRSAFRSGTEPLDRYLQSQAGQDERRRVSACFVAVESATGALAGYYTLAMSAVLLGELPEATARKLPRYPSVPAARLGRLAVDRRFQGQGLGGALLWDAAARAASAEIAAFALLVDAKDARAEAFYQHHGFEKLADGRSLFLPLSALRA